MQRKQQLFRRARLGALAGLAALWLVPLSVHAATPQVEQGSFAFPPSGTTCFQFPEVIPSLGVCGTAGSVDFHLVFPPGDATENSRFMVQGFVGCVTLNGVCALGFTFSTPVSALILVHLGDQPGKPLVLINAGPPGVPHQPLG